MLTPLKAALGTWSPRDPARWQREPHLLLAAVWGEIVGSEIARNSQPVRVTGETLLIVTRSSAWSQQLTFYSERILTAVRARLPKTAVTQLRFRVGKMHVGQGDCRHAASPPAEPAPVTATASPAVTAGDAVARFRDSVEARKRAKRAAGWKECVGCGALIAPRGRPRCVTCENARAQRREAAAARLLFEAPWLGYAGTAELIEGLTRRDYEVLRARLLTRWWEVLARAGASKRLSRGGRERLVASSYVVLKSGLPPEEIDPATVRSVLGDDLHDLIYGTERRTKTNVQ